MNDGSVIKAAARPWLVTAGVAACIVALGACGSDSTGPQARPASTSYTGVIVANNDQGGQLDLQFSSALARRLSNATGSTSFQASGSCSSVCGTAFGALPITGGSVTGDSVTFTFNGGVDNTEFTAGGKHQRLLVRRGHRDHRAASSRGFEGAAVRVAAYLDRPGVECADSERVTA